MPLEKRMKLTDVFAVASAEGMTVEDLLEKYREGQLGGFLTVHEASERVGVPMVHFRFDFATKNGLHVLRWRDGREAIAEFELDAALKRSGGGSDAAEMRRILYGAKG